MKTWVKDNAKVMSLISSSIERTQLQGLITCRTANEMWQSLTRMYEQKSASSKLLLMQRYHEYRMGPSDSVVQHVTHIKNLMSQLRDVGQQIDETDIMAKILGSLPAKYNTLITAWDSVPYQTVGNLLERLIKEKSRMAVEDEATGALAVVGSNKKRGTKNSINHQDGTKTRNGKKFQIECYYCKKKGHMARDCRKKKKGHQGQNGKKPKRKQCVCRVDTSRRWTNLFANLPLRTPKMSALPTVTPRPATVSGVFYPVKLFENLPPGTPKMFGLPTAALRVTLLFDASG
ncbi:copia protein [Lasius niger]|uniref:Copia protein n=1 Tax=Lasius niger TaxID=67767 RepID=A0A0J7K2T9_LASNI|nr:copia protein [Lasius niger]